MDTRINNIREHSLLTLTLVYTSHQKVVLEIDFSGSLWGYTEITLVPTSSELRTIHLHSRQCSIHSVTVSGHSAEFTHNDPLSHISLGSPSEMQDCHRHAELKRKVYSALQEGDEGELSIAIPREVALKQSVHSTFGTIPSETGTPEPQTPGVSQQAQVMPEFSPIVVNIAYSLRNPVDGFEFVLPTESYPYRVPHAYTTPSSPDSARCWVPCVDNIWERCTWELEFVVPRYLEERAPIEDDEEPNDLVPTIVICSGELVEQVAHPNNSNKTIFLFSQSIPTSVQHIAFTAGPFHLYSIPPDNTADDASGASQPLMYAFALPGYENLLPTSTSFLRSAMSFYSTEYGSYPFGSHKVVFVDQLPTQRFDNATLSIVTNDLLFGEDAIEQALETRHSLAHALACQWVGINILPKNWSDSWLTNGLALYITGLYMRKLLGNNDYRFRLKKDMMRVLEWDVGSMPPICQPQVLDPPDAALLPFVNLKAPLILHILDRRLCKSGISLGLSRVLPKVFLSAISGEMPNNLLSTHAFLRTCRKVSGVDPRSFAEQWIYGSGCPSFGFSASFNRKKMAVEITMRQEAPAHKAMENNEVSKVLMKPVPFFEGQMTIRIHEADGTPYEHVLDIRSPFKRYEVPFNTKYKRVRRNTKRYLARQAAAQAAAEGDAEAAEAIGMVDMGFGLEIWENEQERENWKVADWTEEDENVMSGATYEWIRIDADFEWIANMKFEQPDFMWVSQLQRDRDVVAQLEVVDEIFTLNHLQALYALAEKPTAIVSSTLTKTVLVSNYYFRIRCEAALALVNCAIRKLDFLGLFHLFKLFLRYCYDPEDPNQDLFDHTYVPKPSDFSDFAEYFVRKSLINAISRVRFENGKSPAVVRRFLIDQLRYNDNTTNAYSDGFYISAIISAAACANVSTAPPERGEILPSEVRSEHTTEDLDLLRQTLGEVDRYRSMDRLIPSPHNVVTIAVLEFYMVLSLANLIPNHPKIFFPLTREGNYTQVRLAAFDGLFLTKWYVPQIMRYILAVVANDSSRVVRRHVARNVCHSLALLVHMNEMKSNLKETESLLIEEDGSLPEKAKETKKSEMDMMIKVLRKDREVGKNEVLREFLMPIALAPDVDSEVRWCILKLADLLIRPVDETPPSVKIHIPVPETTPLLQSVKLPVKVPRTVKPGGQPTKSPMVPFVSSTRLRLPASPTPEMSRTPNSEQQRRHNVVTASASAATAKLQKFKGRPSKPESKPAPVLKAQSGGMSLNDLRACRNALRKLKSNKHALLFNQPVDPIRDHAPNYFDVIKDPMDLSTMGAKLEEGMYKDRIAFKADFRLMIGNGKTYNAPGTYVHNEAIALETFFEKQWLIINKTLEAADKAHPTPTDTLPKSLTRRTLPPVLKPFVKPGSVVPPPDTTDSSTNHADTTHTGSTSRPVIKLKVNAATSSQSGPTESIPVPKAKNRKAKADDITLVDTVEASSLEPPPPYIDDGSHDILQEVIAIEREKKQRSVVGKGGMRERPLTNGAPGKRKKTDSAFDEDDILALATPSKKERVSPPGPSISKPKPIPPSASAKPSQIVQSKIRKDKQVEPGTPSKITNDIPRVSAKGKEKEVVPTSATVPVPASSQPKLKKLPAQATPFNERKCRDLLRMIQKIPDAAIFMRPVDPVIDGCPTYLDEIVHPMDFGTMTTKLNEGQYETMEDFRKDIELVFSNCRKFNPPGTFPVTCAEVVEKALKKEWPKVTERKLSWTDKRGLQGAMTNLIKDPISWVFREPVDPIALGIPTYFDVIPRKNARDLRTIRQKLDNDKYDTVEAFESDIELMVQNAIAFNGVDSEVGAIAVQLRQRFNELMGAWKSGNPKKRKEGDKSTSQPTKRVKIA